MLGNKGLSVRLGGIYALARLARERGGGPSSVPPPGPGFPLFPHKPRLPPGSARSSLGREAAQRTLDGEDRSGRIEGEGKGDHRT